MTSQTTSRLSPPLKLALEIGPLLVYFLITFKVHERFGIDWGEQAFRPAIIWLIISTPVQVAVLWWGERKVPWSALITAVFLIGFGLVSLALGDDRWIKAKPSIVYLFFASALATGLLMNKPLLKFYLGSQLQATDVQWRRMSINFSIFFVLLALVNEAVWRGLDVLYGVGTDASFQAWSISKPVFMVVSFAFTMWQMWPMIQASVKAQSDQEDERQ